MKHRLSVRNRYRIVAGLLGGQMGALLDVGARDCRLQAYLDPARLHYSAADAVAGLDHHLDLERPLALAERSFDHVVALDVLEHLEAFHDGFRRLARLARRTLLISLPNMAAARHRLSFLLRGRLDTGKYDLLPRHQGDRHRWVTSLPAMDRVIIELGRAEGFEAVAIVDEFDGAVPLRLALAALRRLRLVSRAFASERSVYLLARR
jgi:hypothetical protein